MTDEFYGCNLCGAFNAGIRRKVEDGTEKEYCRACDQELGDNDMTLVCSTEKN